MESIDKYALVTGGTSGIGYELAKLLAADRYNLIIAARDKSALDSKAHEFKRDYGIKVLTFECDLFKPDNAFMLYHEIKNAGISPEIVVNNAAQGLYGMFKDTNITRELDMVSLNISSLIVITKCFLKDMVARNSGKILNVASVASKLPGPWQSVYHGTKAFVLSFTEAIREELKETDITVTALMPGPTDTDFFNKAGMQNSKVLEDKSSLSDPAEVARDGYRALIANEDKVISGIQNKIQVSVSNLTPDDMVAHQVFEQQKPR